MIKILDEAIEHCHEQAEELREEAESWKCCNLIGEPRKRADKASAECLECAEDHEQLASWLEELQERREADRWIPVTEKLPEEETDVLVCNGKGDMIVCRGSRSTEIKDEFIWYICDWRYGEITHWKPLPKAPESEDQ